MAERDPSAQNDGPEELHNPPVPHPTGFEQTGVPYSTIPSASPPLQADTVDATATISGNILNGQAINGINGFAGSNGHLETSTKAVSGEPDSFSDEQVASLSVIVRMHEQQQVPALPPSATRTFSNGSIDSKSGVPDEAEKVNGRQSAFKVNGAGPAQE
jgi:la-related protein 1